MSFLELDSLPTGSFSDSLTTIRDQVRPPFAQNHSSQNRHWPSRIIWFSLRCKLVLYRVGVILFSLERTKSSKVFVPVWKQLLCTACKQLAAKKEKRMEDFCWRKVIDLSSLWSDSKLMLFGFTVKTGVCRRKRQVLCSLWIVEAWNYHIDQVMELTRLSPFFSIAHLYFSLSLSLSLSLSSSFVCFSLCMYVCLSLCLSVFEAALFSALFFNNMNKDF